MDRTLALEAACDPSRLLCDTLNMDSTADCGCFYARPVLLVCSALLDHDPLQWLQTSVQSDLLYKCQQCGNRVGPAGAALLAQAPTISISMANMDFNHSLV